MAPTSGHIQSAKRMQLGQLHALVRSRSGGKSALRQWLEMAALLVVNGNGPGYYQMAGFWQTGQRWSQMRRHLSHRRFRAHVDRLNPRAYQKISQNKIAEKAVLTLMGIPTPRFIGVLDREHGRSASGTPLRGADDLAGLVARDPAQRVCFKLVEGSAGRGFVAADVVRGAETRFRLLGTVDSDSLSATELVERLGREPRVIEVYLDQHPAYASFNPSSVNTVRMWVLRHRGATSTWLAYLRIGRSRSIVDNLGAGGLAAPVDLDTGRVSAAHEANPGRVEYSVHPDHGAPIEGVVLPMFAKAKALAEICLTALPGTNFAGMDVAMTPEGPAIIEANVQPAHTGAAHAGVPSKDVFGL